MIVYGWNPVRELIRAAPERVRYISVVRGEKGRTGQLVSGAKSAGISVRLVSKLQLDRMAPSGAVHNGIAAEVSERSYARLEDLLADGKAEVVFLLDGIRDPQNLGAILRVADAFGVDFVAIPKHESAGLGPTAVKASAGAAEWIKLAQVTNLSRAIEALKESGFWVYAADSGGTPIGEIDLAGKVAIVLGSEGNGIRPIVRRHCDGTISIPMVGHVDSLNVATSASVIAWEILRRRKKSEF